MVYNNWSIHSVQKVLADYVRQYPQTIDNKNINSIGMELLSKNIMKFLSKRKRTTPRTIEQCKAKLYQLYINPICSYIMFADWL